MLIIYFENNRSIILIYYQFPNKVIFLFIIESSKKYDFLESHFLKNYTSQEVISWKVNVHKPNETKVEITTAKDNVGLISTLSSVTDINF